MRRAAGLPRLRAQLSSTLGVMSIDVPESGYIASLQVSGVRVLLHWSFPASWLWWGCLTQFMMGSLSLPIFLWTAFAVAVLVALHELGHAAAAKACNVRVHALLATASGGACLFEPTGSLAKRAAIAIGGITAQFVLIAATALLVSRYGVPTTTMLSCLTIGFLGVNGLIILLNLLPYRGTDGAVLLSLLREALRRRRSTFS